ncbi:hypothetical protein K0G47_18480, partial [Bacteroides thetaiotaomicron]
WLRVSMNFLLWKLPFPGVGTIVSFKGNSRFSVRERPFPNGKHIKRRDPMKIIYYNDNII